MVTFVVSVAVWSIAEKPPSPKSARVQLPSGFMNSVPLSWVPPMVNLTSAGLTAIVSNLVAFNLAGLMVVQVVATSAEGMIPPALPSYMVVDMLGLMMIVLAFE